VKIAGIRVQFARCKAMPAEPGRTAASQHTAGSPDLRLPVGFPWRTLAFVVDGLRLPVPPPHWRHSSALLFVLGTFTLSPPWCSLIIFRIGGRGYHGRRLAFAGARAEVGVALAPLGGRAPC